MLTIRWGTAVDACGRRGLVTPDAFRGDPVRLGLGEAVIVDALELHTGRGDVQLVRG